MDTVVRYRGRTVSTDDIAFVRSLIAQQSPTSRRALSLSLCEAWNWKQPNGTPCDAVCRGLLLMLHRAGHVELPAPRWTALRPPRRTAPRPDVVLDSTAVQGRLSDLGPIELLSVRRTPDEALVEAMLAQHHYLGYVRPVGEHLKYLVRAGGRELGCFCWSSAPRHLGPRDRHIGWRPEVRKRNIHLVAYQTRFLILPWVRVPHLASHLLGRMSRQLSADWERRYAHPIYFTETFVDPTRYRGTCYRAANWTYLGLTTGRGKDSTSMVPNRTLKQLYGYPIVSDFRRRLGVRA